MKKQLFATLALAVMASSAVKAEIVAKSPLADYQPTIVDVDEVQDLWNSMRTGWKKDSVCESRAHVWSYELKDRYNINSVKALMYYNTLYQDVINAGRKYHGMNEFIWYYHIAPAVFTDDGNVTVLDKAVTSPRRPKSIESWVSYAEVKMNKILNDSRSMAAVQKMIAKFESRKKNKYKADRIKAMIAEAKTEDGTYNVQCKRIEHVIDHDTDVNSFCHYQVAAMYYTSQNDLRDLNYNAGYKSWFRGYRYNFISDRSRYTQEDATAGANYKTRTQFNGFLQTAYSNGFGEKIDSEDIIPYRQ